MNRLRSVLDLVATLSMIGASAVLVTVALRSPQRTAPRLYSIGERIPYLEATDFAKANSGVVLWLQSECRYCEQSMPFYRQIADKYPKSPIVILGRESETQLREYAERHGLRATTIRSIGRQDIKLSGTPALAIVGVDLVVRRIWVGKLPNKQAEDEVLAALM